MLDIKCEVHFNRVREFAERKGFLAAFDEQIDWLRKYADPKEEGLWKVEMTVDFAPASFALAWFKRKENGEYEFMMNGALVYHGDQAGWRQDGGYVDPLSVNIAPLPPEKPWAVHT